MHSKVTAFLGGIGLLLALVLGESITILRELPVLKIALIFFAGVALLLHGLNGYLAMKLQPWNGLTLKQVVQMYGWTAFFKGTE